ncbi:MAG: PAS domain-containing protein, partial [Spirochaetes bacterium]|nr:PAS domain-containing protein [Spirochaetota bacterium]
MDESEPKSISILLVEDEPLVAKIQQKQLEAEGYRVFHAKDGLTALTLCRQQPDGIQLILMDIDLGEGIDGADTARQILREHDLPILFLSSHVEPEFVEKTEAIASYGYLVKGSAPSILYASIRMALRLYSARQLASKLSEQENQFKRMFDAIPDLISIHDSQMNILYSNAKVLSVDCSDSLLGRKCYEVYRHRTSVCPDCKQKEVLSNKEIISTEMELDGHWVELRVIPLSNKKGRPDRFMEWVHDVSDQKQLQQSLSFQKLLYEAVLESSTMSIFALDTQYRYISFNRAHAQAMKAMYGVEIQNGHSFYEYQTVPEDITKSKPNIDRCLRGEQFTECAYSGSAGFTRAYVEVSHNPIRNEAGTIIGASFFMRDISERKLAEDRIKELLHEKELQLKETHHRVRNNLNTVYSLLNLRAESALAGYDRNSLAEAAGSVKAMLLLYNRLYVSPDFTEIRLSAYLE